MIIIMITIFIPLAGLAIWILLGGPKLPPETDEIINDVLNSKIPEKIVGKTGIAKSEGLDIWYECISPEGPSRGTVLLIIGAGGSAMDWPQMFINTLVDSGYKVIRYDQRGTGMSDWVEEWDKKNPYSVSDMAGDAVAILNMLNVQETHIIGLSMGGMIAQEIAINHPDRVKSLTLMMTSGYAVDPDLPTMTSSYFISSLLKGIPLLKYRIAGGEGNLIKERIAKTMSSPGYEHLDIKEIAELVLYDLRERRGFNLKVIFQHQTAVSVSGSRYEKLRTLDIPTLVIHGKDDQFIPIEHGKKLVEGIPNAKGIWIDGAGHVFPFPNMNDMERNIVLHLGGDYN